MDLSSHQEFEKVFVKKWSQETKNENAISTSVYSLQFHKGVQTETIKESHMDAMKKDNMNSNGLSSYGISILQVHGCIQ